VSRALALALAVSLCACVHAQVRSDARGVEPSTYVAIPSRLERSVGLLRRLALPPLELEASPTNPSYCLGPCESAAFAAELDSDARRFLSDWRGYEAVDVEATPGLDELARWARSTDDDEPPEPLRMLAQRIAASSRSDGVALLQSELVYLTWFDGVAWYATLTFAIPISMARIGTWLEADVFDARTGRRVWHSRLRAAGTPGTDKSRDLVNELFDGLELALPLVLTRPLP
jgi:hypothetical protein